MHEGKYNKRGGKENCVKTHVVREMVQKLPQAFKKNRPGFEYAEDMINFIMSGVGIACGTPGMILLVLLLNNLTRFITNLTQWTNIYGAKECDEKREERKNDKTYRKVYHEWFKLVSGVIV